uniref:Uncharacterized protein n=1 Tax=Phocoena sinus TaxID=42100 RepID=A0A8C9CB97_PHOSS
MFQKDKKRQSSSSSQNSEISTRSNTVASLDIDYTQSSVQSNSHSDTCAEFRIKYVGAIEKLKFSEGKSLEGRLDLINYIDVTQQDGKMSFVLWRKNLLVVSKYGIKVSTSDHLEQAQAICKVLSTAFDSVLSSEKP